MRRVSMFRDNQERVLRDNQAYISWWNRLPLDEALSSPKPPWRWPERPGFTGALSKGHDGREMQLQMASRFSAHGS